MHSKSCAAQYPQAVWQSIAGVPLLTVATASRTGLAVPYLAGRCIAKFSIATVSNLVAVHCGISSAHRPLVVWRCTGHTQCSVVHIMKQCITAIKVLMVQGPHRAVGLRNPVSQFTGVGIAKAAKCGGAHVRPYNNTPAHTTH